MISTLAEKVEGEYTLKMTMTKANNVRNLRIIIPFYLEKKTNNRIISSKKHINKKIKVFLNITYKLFIINIILLKFNYIIRHARRIFFPANRPNV